jgi:hypothetical protein
MQSVEQGARGAAAAAAVGEPVLPMLDATALMAFATRMQELQRRTAELEAENAELRLFSPSSSTPSRPFPVVAAEDTAPRDEQPVVELPSGKFAVPCAEQQLARSVWRNLKFVKYLESVGFKDRLVETTLVTH